MDDYATRRRRISPLKDTRCELFDRLLKGSDEVCVVKGKDDEFSQCRSQTPGYRTSPLDKHKN